MYVEVQYWFMILKLHSRHSLVLKRSDKLLKVSSTRTSCDAIILECFERNMSKISIKNPQIEFSVTLLHTYVQCQTTANIAAPKIA